ncbi:hypothetical protein ACIBF1_18720 [Spirillospora sp. NPDC050679]
MDSPARRERGESIRVIAAGAQGSVGIADKALTGATAEARLEQ